MKPATLDDIAAFWNAHPMMDGEIDAETGSPAWFSAFDTLQHYDIYLGDVADVVNPALRGKDVLEVGCGPGFWARQLAAIGAEYTGCDIAERAVELARRGQQLANLPGRFFQAPAEELPFAHASFDAVIAMGVLQMTPHADRAVAELFRVLRPGGTGVASVYYKNALLRGNKRTQLALAAARLAGVKLKGRGRESIVAAPTADDLVAMFDGRDNPYARAFSEAEARQLFAPFEIQRTYLTTFPARALPVPIPRWLHRALAANMGFSITLVFRKPG